MCIDMCIEHVHRLACGARTRTCAMTQRKAAGDVAWDYKGHDVAWDYKGHDVAWDYEGHDVAWGYKGHDAIVVRW